MGDHTPNSHSDADDATRESGAAFGAPDTDAAEENAVPTEPAPEPVHRWLDGEQVADADLTAPESARHVKFWAKVNEETERRRRQLTPRGFDAVIMEKLTPPVVKDD